MISNKTIRTMLRTPLVNAINNGDITDITLSNFVWENRSDTDSKQPILVYEQLYPVDGTPSATNLDGGSGFYTLSVYVQTGHGTEIAEGIIGEISNAYEVGTTYIDDDNNTLVIDQITQENSVTSDEYMVYPVLIDYREYGGN